MADYDDLGDLTESDSKGLLASVPWFMIILIIITFLIVNSDIFIDRVLSRVSNAVEQKEPTVWGSLIQASSQALLVTVGIFVNSLISK